MTRSAGGPHRAPGARRWLLSLLSWGIAGGLLLWILSVVPLEETWLAMQKLGAGEIAILIIVNGLVLLTLNGRWWLILRGQGYTVPYLTLTRHRLAAFGVSYLTPGPHFGGEPVQVYLVERFHAVPRPAAVAAVTLDKALELAVNFAFLAGGVALILHRRVFAGKVGEEAAVFALALLALPVGFLLATWAGWAPLSRLLQMGERLPIWRWRSTWQASYQRAHQAMIASEAEATHFCRAAPLFLVSALLVSALSWLLLIAEYWLMLSFVGLPLPFIQMIVALMAARIAILLPLPGGLGTLEASQALALGLMGWSPAAGIGVSLLIRARDVALAGLGLWWGSRLLRAAATSIKVVTSVQHPPLFSMAPSTKEEEVYL